MAPPDDGNKNTSLSIVWSQVVVEACFVAHLIIIKLVDAFYLYKFVTFAISIHFDLTEGGGDREWERFCCEKLVMNSSTRLKYMQILFCMSVFFFFFGFQSESAQTFMKKMWPPVAGFSPLNAVVKLPVVGVQCCWFLDKLQPRPVCRFFQQSLINRLLVDAQLVYWS